MFVIAFGIILAYFTITLVIPVLVMLVEIWPRAMLALGIAILTLFVLVTL